GISNERLMLALTNKGIATSGISRRRWELDGKRIHHIINPENPQQFLFDVKSVSVISQSTVDADVWAKTIFLMGREGGILYANENEMAVAVLDYFGNAWISVEMKKYLYKSFK
ncbi:MAG: hypothetical protein ACD_9C00166G0001, partial [uncultured bacterium]